MKDVLIIDATLPAADNSLAYILEELTNKNSVEIIFNKIRNLDLDKIVLLPVHSNPEIDKIIILCKENNISYYPSSHEIKNKADQLKEINTFVQEKKYDNVILCYIDSPFIDMAEFNQLHEMHIENLAEYTFGDNFAEGLVPEIMSKDFLNKIIEYAYKKPDVVSRKVFDCLHADINKFFIELDISEYDFSMMRLSLTVSSKRNFNVVKNVLKHITAFDDYKKIFQTIKQNPDILYIYPKYIELEITNNCNMKCIFCPRNKMTRNMKDMDFNVFKKIIDELGQEYDDIVLNFALMGEPLLHPQFLQFIEYALKQSKIFNVIIETNGILFNKEITENLSVYPPEKLIVIFGLDSLKEEIYQKLRISDETDVLSKVKENIAYFLQYHPVNKLRTFIQMIKMKENNLELEEIYTFWQKQGVPLVIQKYNTYLNLLEDRSVVDLTPLDRIPCWHLQRDMEIFSNGDVAVCKQDINGNLIIGNLIEQSVKEIWEKNKNNFIANYKEEYEKLAICKNCDEWYTFNF